MNTSWLLFSFNGRIGRLAYAAVVFGVPLGGLALVWMVARILGVPRPASADAIGTATAALRQLQGPMVLVQVVTAWISLAAATKRLHDIGKSGWLNVYILASFFGAGAIMAIGAAEQFPTCVIAGAFLLMIVALYALWIGLLLLVRAGDGHPNNFGAPGDQPAAARGLDEARGSTPIGANGFAMAGAANAGFGKRR